MSFLGGILRFYVFCLLWGVSAGAIGLLLGFRADNISTSQIIVAGMLGLAALLVVLGAAELLTIKPRQQVQLVMAMAIYCVVGYWIVKFVHRFSWYPPRPNQHEVGFYYFSYYFVVVIGHLLVVAGVCFYFLNVLGIKQKWTEFETSQVSPLRSLWDFIVLPIKDIVLKSFGLPVFLLVLVTISVFLVIGEKQQPLHESGYVIITMTCAMLISAIMFRLFDFRRANRLLHYSLEKSSFDALALAGELSREQDAGQQKAIEQHWAICSKYSRHLTVRLHFYASSRQYQRYFFWLRPLYMKGLEAASEFEQLSKLLLTCKHLKTDPNQLDPQQMINKAATISRRIYSKLRGDWLSLEDFTGPGPKIDISNTIDDLTFFLDEAEKFGVRDFAFAEATCMKTRGAWLEELPLLLDLAIDRTEILNKLISVLGRAREAMTEVLQTAESNANQQPEEIHKLMHYIENVSRRIRAVESLKAKSKDTFLEAIKPDNYDLNASDPCHSAITSGMVV
jgi:hypothetical protein